MRFINVLNKVSIKSHNNTKKKDTSYKAEMSRHDIIIS